MRPFFVVNLLTILLLSPTALAEDLWQYKVDLGLGLRGDTLQYQHDGLLTGALAGNGSGMKITPSSIYQIELGYRFISDNLWYVKGYFHQGSAYLGDMQQTSYHQTTPDAPWAKYESTQVTGSTNDRSFAIGRQWRWQQKYAITPLFGYSTHHQNWATNGGQQTVCTATGQQSCLLNAGVMSSEKANWQSQWSGPWLGVDMRYNYNNWTWNLEVESHLVHYDASLSWQGTQTLAGINSINQSGSGRGTRLGLGASYWVGDGFVNINLNQSNFSVANGVVQTTPLLGATVSQSMNSLLWKNQVVSLSYTGRF
jgi:hypothetical protein